MSSLRTDGGFMPLVFAGPARDRSCRQELVNSHPAAESTSLSRVDRELAVELALKLLPSCHPRTQRRHYQEKLLSASPHNICQHRMNALTIFALAFACTFAGAPAVCGYLHALVERCSMAVVNRANTVPKDDANAYATVKTVGQLGFGGALLTQNVVLYRSIKTGDIALRFAERTVVTLIIISVVFNALAIFSGALLSVLSPLKDGEEEFLPPMPQCFLPTGPPSLAKHHDFMTTRTVVRKGCCCLQQMSRCPACSVFERRSPVAPALGPPLRAAGPRVCTHAAHCS
jgi:hypothetical protein